MDAIVTQPATTTTPPTATAAAETVTLMCLACGYEADVAPDALVTRIAAHTHDEPEQMEKAEPAEEDPQAPDPAAPSIEELLATPARFRAWLERMSRGYGPDYVIGQACASFACPLNQFLADETGRDRLTIEVELAPPLVQLWRLDATQEEAFEDGPELPLPAWAARFARQVDLYPAGRKVRVDEAIFLLTFVEERLSHEA